MVSVRLAKWLCVLVLFANAFALYFIDRYGVVIDRTLMGNVFNTNAHEALDLFHPRLVLYLVALAAVPAALIAAVRVPRDVRGLAVALMVVCAGGSGWIYANAKSWLWLDRNFSTLGGLMLPWSYAVNSVRYFQSVAVIGDELQLAPARVVRPGAAIVVLVIGESARAKDFSLYGYARDTNPRLARAGAVALPDARSCATYTTASVACMLSHLGSRSPAGKHYEPLPTYLQREGVDVTWRTNNFGEPALKVGRYDKASDIRGACTGTDCARLSTDDVLLEGLDALLKAPGAAKRLIVLHQSGSHGPLYSSKYPPRFDVFQPVCRTVDVQKCTQAELLNAYDNTILYTDDFLGRVIDDLKRLEATEAVMLYVSDHGESLGEYGLYLHGAPSTMAPDVQTRIPMIVWMSDSFARARHLDGKRFGGRQPYSQDAVFHSVMGALGLEGDPYDKSLDIFRAPP
jgi:lipid A ethanolaminephosphotransferase